VLTTAFTSTTIAFDYDTSPTKLSYATALYGYVPDGNKARLKVFLLMFLIIIALVTSTSMGMAFLFTMSPSSAHAYLAASMGVYLLYRACRRDLHYWVPLEGKTGWFVSICMRVVGKVFVDFTGCIHFRHPVELGGLYYSPNLLQAQVGSAVFAKLYVNANEGDTDALTAEMVYTVVVTASVAVGVQLLAFLRAHQEGLWWHVLRHTAPSNSPWTYSTIPRAAMNRRQRLLQTRACTGEASRTRSASSLRRSGQRGSKRSRSGSTRICSPNVCWPRGEDAADEEAVKRSCCWG